MQWLTKISANHVCISEMERIKCPFSFEAIHGFCGTESCKGDEIISAISWKKMEVVVHIIK